MRRNARLSIGCSPYLWAKRHCLRGLRIVRKTCDPLKARSASLKPLCSRCRTELEATVLHLREVAETQCDDSFEIDLQVIAPPVAAGVFR